MAWFKVDDKLHSHRKTVRAGEAMALWVIAGSWCADQLTDGFVPDYMVGRFVPGGESMADRLVEVGLWYAGEHEGDSGWWFRDWCDYQPSRSDVEDRRERERQKKRDQRRGTTGQFEESPGESPGDTSGTGDGHTEGVLPSRPVPSRPDRKETSAPNESARKQSQRKPDVVWDAVMEACGLNQSELTQTARGAANKAVKELKQIDASPEVIKARAAEHRRRWPNAECTPTSLAKNYAQLGTKRGVESRPLLDDGLEDDYG